MQSRDRDAIVAARARGRVVHSLLEKLPALDALQRAAQIVAPWASGRWFSQSEALDAGLPAPLRKLLLQVR